MSRPLQTAAAALAAATVALALWVPAVQACGGTESSKATKKVNPGGHAPLAIGDSTMLLALPDLAHEGYQVNARGCRQIDEGLGVMRDYKRRRRLPHLVVIALGADATLSKYQLEKAFHLIGPKRVLGLVTPIELGGGTSGDADVVRAEAKRHPKRSVLLDWVAYSKGHPAWFQPDGLHLTFDGAAGFARLLRQALPYAKAGAQPGRPPTGKSGLGKHPIALG
ncbi:MAG TPA: hypothetical protein VGO24_06690 [Solirubrobacterales bacterium]|jgi:hypothetical protein|nr:hypothetical protein [Solirubrobacterales bacterium]